MKNWCVVAVFVVLLAWTGGCSNKESTIGVKYAQDHINMSHLDAKIPIKATFSLGKTFQEQPVISKMDYTGGVVVIIPTSQASKETYEISNIFSYYMQSLSGMTFAASAQCDDCEYAISFDYQVNSFRGQTKIVLGIIPPPLTSVKSKTDIDFIMTIQPPHGAPLQFTHSVEWMYKLADVFPAFQADIVNAFLRGDIGAEADPGERAAFLLRSDDSRYVLDGLRLIAGNEALLGSIRGNMAPVEEPVNDGRSSVTIYETWNPSARGARHGQVAQPAPGSLHDRVAQLAGAGNDGRVQRSAQAILDKEQARVDLIARKTAVLFADTRRLKVVKDPLAAITSRVAAREKEWVAMADQPIPPEIPTPRMPPALKLEQGKYESNARFDARVKEEQGSRKIEIKRIQADYKKRVDERNARIEALRELHAQRLKELPGMREIFIAEAVKDVFQGVRVGKPHYDRETALLSFDLEASGAAYSERVGIRLDDPELVQTLAEHPEKGKWRAVFRGEGNGFVLDNVTCEVSLRDVVFHQVEGSTMLAEGSPRSVTIAQTSGEDLSAIAALQMQAPDLADYNDAVTLTYNDGRVIHVAGDSEMAARVKRMATAKADSHAYLLAVGIENYTSVPGVPFAENSLRTVVELLTRKYGIPQANRVVLAGNAATGQAIRGNMRNLAARVTTQDRLFFYYAGHGLAGKDGKDVFLLPVDAVQGALEDEDFAFNRILVKTFARAGSVYAFLDTCFSGRADGKTMLQKGIAPIFKTTPYNLPDNMTAFFAGQGDQFANYYQEKGHRLFSYFLAESLLDDRVAVGDMEAFLKRNVREVSARMGADHLQEPFVGGNTARVLGE
ncbi:MAG: caspase domain-containing protein [Desulfovibrionaceae bacterium]